MKSPHLSRSCRRKTVAPPRSCRRKTVAARPLIRALASAPTFHALASAATLLLTLLPSTLRAQSTNEPPPFLRTGPSLTQAPEGATPFVKNRWMDRNGDGWDDLWLLISNMAAPKGKDLDKAQDTDGDGVSDYDEMLHWRDPRVKGPPLGWPNYTVEELLQAQIAAAAMRRTNEAAMARRREHLRHHKAVSVSDSRRSGRTLHGAYLNGLKEMRERHLREMPPKRQRMMRAKAIYDRIRTPDGRNLEEAFGFLFHDEENGNPTFAELYNVNAAATIHADEVYLPASGGGLGRTGAGVLFAHFDGAIPLESHPEFLEDGQSRLDFIDSDLSGTLQSKQHATHTAGTLASGGSVQATSRGMSSMAKVDSLQLSGDVGKMIAIYTNEISPGALDSADDFVLSNHSYGHPSGWTPPMLPGGLWGWYGSQWTDPEIHGEDGYFGAYSTISSGLDWFTRTAVYPLLVFAVGNDRLQGPPLDPPMIQFLDIPSGEISEYVLKPGGFYEWTLYPPPPADGGVLGWDTISTNASAKNVLSVGSVVISNGQIIASEFSGAGPTDDGRIKPDVVAKGEGLYSTSTTASATPTYAQMTGTSMATPSVCGALGLIVEHYRQIYGAAARLWASSLKALAIHCADDVGNPGPDFRFGWGVLNARRMADVITADGAAGGTAFLRQVLLHEECEFSIKAIGPSTPVRVTICWTDYPGGQLFPHGNIDNPNPTIDADVDLRVNPAAGNPHMPWILNRLNPGANATKGDNSVDNVEVVDFIPSTPGEVFTVRLTVPANSYWWSQFGDNVPVSIVITGIEAPEPPPFRIVTTTQVSAPENIYAIEWPSVVGGFYRFETSTDLVTWTPAEGVDGPAEDVSATHELSSFELKAGMNEPRQFWRVRRIEAWDLANPEFPPDE